MSDDTALHHRTLDVMTAARENPPPFLAEYEAWFGEIFGPRPREDRVRARADWDCAWVSGLFAWGYFAEQLAQAVKRQSPPVPQTLPTPHRLLGPDGRPL